MYAIDITDNQSASYKLGINNFKSYLQKSVLYLASLSVSFKYIIFATIFSLIIISPNLSLQAQAPNVNLASKTINTSVILRSDSENYYLQTINNLRAGKKLKPLVIDSRLTKSAFLKGIDMSEKNYWGHYAPAGKSFAEFVWQNSPNANTVGENLAKCYTSRQDSFNALVASPTHYAIMVGNFSNFGVSEVKDKNSGCINTVMHFSRYN